MIPPLFGPTHFARHNLAQCIRDVDARLGEGEDAAGSVQGDAVVCGRAIRDEGVSDHYLAPAWYAHASVRLTAQLEQTVHAAGLQPVRGASWTIDTPCRETVAEARHYQAEGVMTVEMETAALFAVAEYRGVEPAAAFAISDSLAELVWNPQFHTGQTQSALESLFGAAVEALRDDPSGASDETSPATAAPILDHSA